MICRITVHAGACHAPLWLSSVSHYFGASLRDFFHLHYPSIATLEPSAAFPKWSFAYLGSLPWIQWAEIVAQKENKILELPAQQQQATVVARRQLKVPESN
jgi:hypothetical protein